MKENYKFRYDKKYFYHFYYTHSPTAELISNIRWNFVSDIKPKIVLDYGSGCGFLSKYAPSNIIIDTYDIGRLNGESYPQTGIVHDKYDLIFFNDVLEHVDWDNEPDEKMEDIFLRTKYICASVPLFPHDKKLEGWKHYKPGEHLTNFDYKTLTQFFVLRNFSVIKWGFPECPPREDVATIVVEKK